MLSRSFGSWAMLSAIAPEMGTNGCIRSEAAAKRLVRFAGPDQNGLPSAENPAAKEQTTMS